jgi:transposase InsO family protein
VTAALLKAGVEVNEKRVARLMAELGIAGKCGRRKLRTTRRDPAATPAADLVERDFTADAPDELWVGDITYIATDEGWLFVASVLDVCTRLVVGWSIADHMRTELCTDALSSAAAARGHSWFAGTVFHSELGRTRARCQPFSWSVSLVRPPNRTCDLHRIRLSIASFRRARRPSLSLSSPTAREWLLPGSDSG